MRISRSVVFVSLSFLTFAFSSDGRAAPATDWSGWQGPNHDRKSSDTGLLKEWPEDGPKRLWSVDSVGQGYGSIAVSGDSVYTSGVVKDQLTVFAFSLDGKLKWKTEFDSSAKKNPPGSRSTPTIDDGRLYLLSGNGVVGCFDARTGEKKWTRAASEFDGGSGGWGYAESVLIHDELAIFKPGGKNCIAALNKVTGETVWTSSGFEAGPEYGSCLPVSFQNRKMIVTGTNRGIVAVDAKDGKLLWQNDFSARNTANCPTPAYADGFIFWANGYGKGGICLKLKAEGDSIKADVAWTSRDMDCQHGGYVIHDGYIYGNHDRGWSCLELATGKLLWTEKAVGKGSLCFADGMLYLFAEDKGQAGLGTCSPERLDVKGKFKVAGKDKSWAHPVVCGGRLYLRYDTNLYCFDVKRS